MKSDIRVDFTAGEGSYSYVGQECLSIPKTSKTMNFGWFFSADNPNEKEYRRTTLHEFGHALGFFHEL